VLKKTITYEDFTGETVSEDFFFHLSKAELIEIEMSYEGGLSEALKRIIAAEDAKSIIAEFKNIIMTSYGKKSPDGKRFIKNDQIREEFASSEAYSTLFMELVTDTGAAVNFINGVIPAGMAEEVAKTASVTPLPVPEPTKEVTTVTKAQLNAMDAASLNELGRRVAAGEAVIAE
jgi:hypothetical protein